MTPILLAWTKNKTHSLKNEELKANRDSEVSEEQSKERLWIGREKDRARRIKRGKEKSSETEDHEKQRFTTLKRLK